MSPKHERRNAEDVSEYLHGPMDDEDDQPTTGTGQDDEDDE